MSICRLWLHIDVLALLYQPTHDIVGLDIIPCPDRQDQVGDQAHPESQGHDRKECCSRGRAHLVSSQVPGQTQRKTQQEQRPGQAEQQSLGQRGIST